MWEVKNTSSDRTKATLHRLANKMEMEPMIGGERLKLRKTMVIDDETQERLSIRLANLEKDGVIELYELDGLKRITRKKVKKGEVTEDEFQANLKRYKENGQKRITAGELTKEEFQIQLATYEESERKRVEESDEKKEKDVEFDATDYQAQLKAYEDDGRKEVEAGKMTEDDFQAKVKAYKEAHREAAGDYGRFLGPRKEGDIGEPELELLLKAFADKKAARLEGEATGEISDAELRAQLKAYELDGRKKVEKGEITESEFQAQMKAYREAEKSRRKASQAAIRKEDQIKQGQISEAELRDQTRAYDEDGMKRVVVKPEPTKTYGESHPIPQPANPPHPPRHTPDETTSKRGRNR